MGILDRLFGSGTTDTLPAQFEREAVIGPVNTLIGALDALADSMAAEAGKCHNPGWRGRIRDLRNSSGSLTMVLRNKSFERDELFEALTTVRPLFRGTAPAGYEHLSDLNQRVADAIEAVHAAA